MKARLIHHQLLVVDDLEKARDFYGRILGLTEIKTPNPNRPAIWFGCLSNELHLSKGEGIKGGRTRMSLQPHEREGREGRHVAFTVDGTLDDIKKALKEENIPFARSTGRFPQIFFEDPAGNLLELNTGWKQEPIE